MSHEYSALSNAKADGFGYSITFQDTSLENAINYTLGHYAYWLITNRFKGKKDWLECYNYARAMLHKGYLLVEEKRR